MKEFFKLMHNVANTDKREYDNILDLTIDVAKSGGYHRKQMTYKNGVVSERTFYNVPSTWNDALVAKWYCYYEKLFRYRIGKLPRVKEYESFILQRVFTCYFNSINLDKLTSSACVTKSVALCLTARINEVLILLGDEERLIRFNESSGVRKSKDRINMSTAINEMAYSLDYLIDDLKEQFEYKSMDEASQDIIVDIGTKLEGNNVGKAFFDALLNSERKVTLTNLGLYLNIKEKEFSKEVKENIKSALKIIKTVLYDYLKMDNYDVSKFNWTNTPHIRYGRGGN